MPGRGRELKLRATLAWLATALAIAACGGTRYVRVSPPAPGAPRYRAAPMAVGSGWQSAFFFGLLPRTRRIEAGRICGRAGIAELRTGRTAGQALLAMLSVGVYSPSLAEVVCGPASSAAAPDAGPEAAHSSGDGRATAARAAAGAP